MTSQFCPNVVPVEQCRDEAWLIINADTTRLPIQYELNQTRSIKSRSKQTASLVNNDKGTKKVNDDTRLSVSCQAAPPWRYGKNTTRLLARCPKCHGDQSDSITEWSLQLHRVATGLRLIQVKVILSDRWYPAKVDFSVRGNQFTYPLT